MNAILRKLGGSLLLWLCLLNFLPVWRSAAAEATNAPVEATGFQAARQPLAQEGDVYLTFFLNRIPALQYEFPKGIPLWQYVASAIYIFLAFYASKAADRLTRDYLKNWARKTKTKFDDILLTLLNGPIKVIVFVIFLHIGLRVFAWTGWVEDFMSKGLKIIVAITLTYLLLKVVDMAVGYWRARVTEREASFDDQLFPVVNKSLKAFIVIVAVLVTTQNLGINVTGLIASLSIGGLALGLAAQDTVANLFGAVAVFVDKPFRIGDRIKLGDVDGVVETIGLRSTRVRNLDGHLITVPNKTMGNATITNLSRRPTIKTEMNIGVTYDLSKEKIAEAVAILHQVYGGHPMTKEVTICFNKFADSSLNLNVVHLWANADLPAQTAGIHQMNMEIKERFDRAGIAFAYPTQTLFVKQDSRWQLDPGADKPLTLPTAGGSPPEPESRQSPA